MASPSVKRPGGGPKRGGPNGIKLDSLDVEGMPPVVPSPSFSGTRSPRRLLLPVIHHSKAFSGWKEKDRLQMPARDFFALARGGSLYESDVHMRSRVGFSGRAKHRRVRLRPLDEYASRHEQAPLPPFAGDFGHGKHPLLPPSAKPPTTSSRMPASSVCTIESFDGGSRPLTALRPDEEYALDARCRQFMGDITAETVSRALEEALKFNRQQSVDSMVPSCDDHTIRQ